MAQYRINCFLHLIVSLLILSSLALLPACKHPLPEGVEPELPDGGDGDGDGDGNGDGDGEGSGNCDPGVVYFEKQVLPILIANCARSGCHNASSAQDGVVLTSYARVMATADVRPGDPDGSDLYEVLVEDDHEDRMPPSPNQPLGEEQIELIEEWIEQGAKNLSCTEGTGTCVTENVQFSAHVKPLIQTKCIGCHSASLSSGGVNLSTHAGVVAATSNGRLLGAVRHEQGFTPMPQGGQKLSQCEIDQLAAWVAAGMPEN